MAWRRLLHYPTQGAFLALAAVCLASAVLVGGIAWRTLRQLDRIGAEAEHGAHLHQTNGLLQHLVQEQRAGGPPDPSSLAQVRNEVAAFRQQELELHGRVGPRLERVQKLLAAAGTDVARLEDAAHLLDDVVRDQTAERRELLGRLREEARAELETSTALFAALVLLGLGGAWVVQRRILNPLGDLRTMFLELGGGEFRPIAVEHVHPVLAPLFDNYNRLVLRLEKLEGDHRSRAAHLEREVRSATEALLEQQRTLARAERLAAVGEMAAGLAHELRNPLAGVHMNLANLRRDLPDPQLAARLDLAIAELERLTRLLNHQLSMARHVPETPRRLRLRPLVDELLALLRYRVPPHVHLESEMHEDLECRLPRDRLRQALLNLVLNSVQALGEDKGSVHLHARREGERLILEVTDDGPGFPPELLRAGSQAFVTRRASGTGLGLAMVRRLVADLGGEIALENPQPRGARVRLTLPCHA